MIARRYKLSGAADPWRLQPCVGRKLNEAELPKFTAQILSRQRTHPADMPKMLNAPCQIRREWRTLSTHYSEQDDKPAFADHEAPRGGIEQQTRGRAIALEVGLLM
jgi:hypothetical protein